MTPVVLTIAGSDPGGGAGIQSDLRTFAALGVIGVSVITAITVQNSLGVQSVHPIDADILAAQLEAILSDTKVAAVKIGMLGGAQQVRVVAAALRKYQPTNVVLDPVLASTGGVPLLDAEGCTALLTELMPLCDVITPNVPELDELTGMATTLEGDRRKAVGRLQAQGAKAVLVKGGHLPNSATDRLYMAGTHSRTLMGKKLETLHTHGTGCLLSAAIAACLAAGLPLEEAARKAKAIVTRSLQFPVIIGKGRGYPYVQQGVTKKAPIVHCTHAILLSLLHGVYVVTDPDLRPDRDCESIWREAMLGGAHVVQLREKTRSTPDLINLARRLDDLRFEWNTLVIVNDRVDVALASGADGVHLGPGDMKPEDARRLLGPDKLVGVSVATAEEAKAAAPFASYFGVGAIFGTKTKLDAGAAIGLGRIREIKAAFPDIPIVAIGGINLNNIAEVAAAGADAAAVVSAVVSAPDMAEATHELLRRFEAGKGATTPPRQSIRSHHQSHSRANTPPPPTKHPSPPSG